MEKLVPVQLVPVEDQERVAVFPVEITEALVVKLETVQAGVLQAWLSTGEPEQFAPPFEGAGLVQVRVRVCVPLCPQAVTEHALHELQALQPPFTIVPQVEPFQLVPEAQVTFAALMDLEAS